MTTASTKFIFVYNSANSLKLSNYYNWGRFEGLKTLIKYLLIIFIEHISITNRDSYILRGFYNSL